MPDPVLSEQGSQAGCAADVVVDILLRLLNAFPNGLVGGKMDRSMHRLVEDRGHRRRISTIDTVPFNFSAHNAPNARHGLFAAVPEVVHQDGFVAGFDQGNGRVGADESGTSGYHDAPAFLRAVGHAAISVTFPPHFP